MDDPAQKDILDIIGRVPFGEISFSVHKHAGKIHNIIANEFKTVKYSATDPHANSKAVAYLIQLMKDASKAQDSGAVSFTVTFHKGTITKMTLAGYENKNYAIKDEITEDIKN